MQKSEVIMCILERILWNSESMICDVIILFVSHSKVKIIPASQLERKTKNVVQDKSSSEKDWELVPPDGGWGWLILAGSLIRFSIHLSGVWRSISFFFVPGSMLVNILVPGTVKSCGVLIVEFSEAFHASASSTAWIPSLCYFLYSSLGNFSAYSQLKIECETMGSLVLLIRSIVEHIIS